MTDHQQAALTAMQDEIYRQLNCQYGDFNIPSNEEVKAILAAAEPHLRKKVRAEVAEKAWDEGFMRANRLVNCRMCRGTTVPKINPYTV